MRREEVRSRLSDIVDCIALIEQGLDGNPRKLPYEQYKRYARLIREYLDLNLVTLSVITKTGYNADHGTVICTMRYRNNLWVQCYLLELFKEGDT